MRRWWGNSVSGSRPDRQGVLARLRRDTAGNTLAIAGAALVPIAAMIGSGLDMSRAYMAQAKLQNACDAAALAARRTMIGSSWSTAAQTQGERFFHFNFPDDTMNASDLELSVEQADDDHSVVEVRASADVPTTVMGLFGKEFIPISVECDADQDFGNNDIMVVLDLTGSMNEWASGGGGRRIDRLRQGAIGLYRALADDGGARTRFGFMPYSVTVNVGRDLDAGWVRDPASYRQCVDWDRRGNCTDYDLVSVDHSNTWLNNWRGSDEGSGCIEERATVGEDGDPIAILTSVSQADIDQVSTSNPALKWAPYDTSAQEAESSRACPRRAHRLAEYATESAYQNRIDDITEYVGGNTYHDIGIVWGARYLSSTGMFAADNPTEWNEVPVAKHIVFMTDGILEPSSSVYSAYGVEREDYRLGTSGSQHSRHLARFVSACNRAKQMGMTIWVIALDVTSTDDIEPCATSSGHFFVSDGSDLEDVFQRIGQGIARLRLTQ